MSLDTSNITRPLVLVMTTSWHCAITFHAATAATPSRFPSSLAPSPELVDFSSSRSTTTSRCRCCSSSSAWVNSRFCNPVSSTIWRRLVSAIWSRFLALSGSSAILRLTDSPYDLWPVVMVPDFQEIDVGDFERVANLRVGSTVWETTVRSPVSVSGLRLERRFPAAAGPRTQHDAPRPLTAPPANALLKPGTCSWSVRLDRPHRTGSSLRGRRPSGRVLRRAPRILECHRPGLPGQF